MTGRLKDIGTAGKREHRLGRLGIAVVVAALGLTTMAAAIPSAMADSQTPLRGALEGSVLVAPCGVATLCLTGTMEGNVSHLGSTTMTKAATIRFTGGSCAGSGSASTYTETVTLAAANGDTLHLAGAGTACAAAGHAIGHTALTVTSGTGRFDGATGTVSESLDHDLGTGGEVVRLVGTVSSPGATR